MGNEWGVDSTTRADNAGYNGCGQSNQTLAWYVKDCYFYYPPPPDTINFWGRYFSPSITSPTFDTEGHPGLEVGAMRAVGIYYIFPITEPSDLNGNNSQTAGFNDAKATCDAIVNMIYGGVDDGHCLGYPSTNEVWIYLAVEGSWTLTSNYWKGWVDEVWSYVDSHTGRLPFYPGVYTNCNSQVCGVVQNGDHAAFVKVWASEPDYSANCGGAYCSSPGPSWGPCGCSGDDYTSLWQYGIYPGNGTDCQACPGFPPVDVDQSNPNVTETNFMLTSCG